MAKQELTRKETAVVGSNGAGQQYEQTLTVDDTCLPSAEELAAYQKVDPQIVPFLIDVSRKEQEHRHKMDAEKIRLVRNSDSRIGRMNWWGMFFAFLSIVVLVALTGYALYLNISWFAGMMGIGTIVSVASVFIKNDKSSPTAKK